MKPKYLLPVLFLPSLHAAELTPSTPGPRNNLFGTAVSLSGGTGIISARHDKDRGIFSGAIHVFRNLDTATGDLHENSILTVSNARDSDDFGSSISLFGETALVGARYTLVNSTPKGAAYLFRDLNGGTSTAMLTASDGGRDDSFGQSVSLSGSIGLVSAWSSNTIAADSGAAYVFRNLDTATGTITQDVKLLASNGAARDYFGNSVSLSGTMGLVGAMWSNSSVADSGSAYIYRNLDTATGTITENARLTASDPRAQHFFGDKVHLSGTTALITSHSDAPEGNVIYLFRNLDTATGTITEDARLISSGGFRHGFAISLSGNAALASGPHDVDGVTRLGSVYLYRNLDTATGTITENLRIFASDGESNDGFANSASLDGDTFLVAASSKSSPAGDRYVGKAYTGSVGSMTTLDLGAASRTISGLSFYSNDDWIIGQTTDGNTVTLSAGDGAQVTAAGRAVQIGRESGSNGNALVIAGNLNATTVQIGSQAGNAGNFLRLSATASIDVGTIQLAAGNFLSIAGDHTADVLTYLDDTALRVWTGGTWQTVTPANQSSLLSASYAGGFTTFGVIPEPSGLLLAILGAVPLLCRRR